MGCQDQETDRSTPAGHGGTGGGCSARVEGDFDSKIGSHRFKIGTDLFPKPQIMGYLLHELIPLEFAVRYPDKWRGEQEAGDKDFGLPPDPRFSFEIRTSSHKSQIFGTEATPSSRPTRRKQERDYLAVNFQSFNKRQRPRPDLSGFRFGWLDHTDWVGQAAATGQQANSTPESEGRKTDHPALETPPSPFWSGPVDRGRSVHNPNICRVTSKPPRTGHFLRAASMSDPDPENGSK